MPGYSALPEPDGFDCKKCGQTHAPYTCRGHRRRVRPLTPCKSLHRKGLNVCHLHGAKPEDIEAGRDRYDAARVEHQLSRILEERGIRPVDNPIEELARMAGEMRSFVDELRARVNLRDLKSSELIVYERFVDRSIGLLNVLARLDLDGRIVKVREAEALILVRVVSEWITTLEIPNAEEATRDLGARLRLVSAS